jgi:hypothetical protein
MKRSSRIAIAATGVLALAAVGSGIAVASSGGDDSSGPITGLALERASQAALAATGGGRVTETEVGDEDSYYEVEVTLDDGTQVDVQLDQSFQVVSHSSDHDGSEHDGADDGSDPADG